MSAAPRRSLCCAMTRCRAASPTRSRPHASWRTTLRIRTFSAYAISSSACRWRRDGGQALMPVLPSGHGFGTVTSQESSSTEARKCFTARTTFWIGLACHGESSPRGAAIAGIERETRSRATTEIFFINPPSFLLEGRPSTLRSDREHRAPTRNSLQSRAFREQAGCASIELRSGWWPDMKRRGSECHAADRLRLQCANTPRVIEHRREEVLHGPHDLLDWIRVPRRVIAARPVFLSRRGPTILLPYTAIVLAGALYLRLARARPFLRRLLLSAGSFMIATLILYVFIARFQVHDTPKISMLGHAWRLALMLLIGGVSASAVA